MTEDRKDNQHTVAMVQELKELFITRMSSYDSNIMKELQDVKKQNEVQIAKQIVLEGKMQIHMTKHEITDFKDAQFQKRVEPVIIDYENKQAELNGMYVLGKRVLWGSSIITGIGAAAYVIKDFLAHIK